MKARITHSFRIAEGKNTRKYTPGDVAEGGSAEWAIKNGYGEQLENKAAKPARNKASK